MIKYWTNLLNCSENVLLRNVYMLLDNDAIRNISYNGKTWAYQIKTMLQE